MMAQGTTLVTVAAEFSTTGVYARGCARIADRELRAALANHAPFGLLRRDGAVMTLGKDHRDARGDERLLGRPGDPGGGEFVIHYVPA
jgi:hypothetical protein